MQRAPDDWHRDFFSGLWLEVQANSFSAAETKQLVDAGQEALQLMPGARVLDVPCGSGRTAIELASRGFEVTAVERSPELLAMAKQQAAARKVDIDWIEQDMWSLELDRRYDAALCLWSSLGYGTEEQDDAFLASMAECLDEGGSLLIETHVTETLLPWFEPEGWRWAGDIAVAESRSIDHRTGRIETEWLLSSPSVREQKLSSLRLYSYREIAEKLAQHGFDQLEAFGSPELEPFELGSPRLILSARRSDPRQRS